MLVDRSNASVSTTQVTVPHGAWRAPARSVAAPWEVLPPLVLCSVHNARYAHISRRARIGVNIGEVLLRFTGLARAACTVQLLVV